MTTHYPPCPKCQSTEGERIKHHPHYGMLGPLLMKMVKCHKCGEIYNGKTGTKDGLDGYKKIAGLILIFGLALLIGFVLEVV